MLCRYELIIDGVTHELGSDCLKNWADIECAYKREDYNGVMREFTSQFEFVNEAYDLLMALYDKSGFNSQATLKALCIDNNWRYKPLFSCDLDFSSLNYTPTTLSINAIDNGLAAKIKANKGTKYEFVVGEDIPTSYPYIFDRLEMSESVTYSITDGESQDDGSLFGTYNPSNNGRIYVGETNKEIAVGGMLLCNEDQEYEDGYLFKALNEVELILDYDIEIDISRGCDPLLLCKNNSTPLGTLTSKVDANPPMTITGWPSLDRLITYLDGTEPTWRNDSSWLGVWTTIDGIVYVVMRDSDNSNIWVNTGKTKGEYGRKKFSGKIAIRLQPEDIVWIKYDSADEADYSIGSSKLQFSWTSKGETVSIDTIRPLELIEAIASKIAGCDVSISEKDSRLANTLLLPAESIRGIKGAKIYSSFNDFCDWIETVFGYVYTIDEENNIITFLHREELFANNSYIKVIENATDGTYSIDNNVIYSSVVIGYDDQDYDSINGRDEFNFANTYTTGYTITDKKLELKSKYRADCYGIEFAVEKRGADTTDSDSDDDIFFVQGEYSYAGEYYPYRRTLIEGGLSNTLFNGEFSPMRCVNANAEYIALMAKQLTLTFASAEGNTDIVVGGVKMNNDLVLEDCEMLTAGLLTFTTDDMDIPEDLNTLIQVVVGGYKYTGYIDEVAIRLARPQSVQYTLKIKSKEIC